MGRADADACGADGGDSFIPDSASAEVKAYFALQQDGSFTSDTIMFEAHKAI